MISNISLSNNNLAFGIKAKVLKKIIKKHNLKVETTEFTYPATKSHPAASRFSGYLMTKGSKPENIRMQDSYVVTSTGFSLKNMLKNMAKMIKKGVNLVVGKDSKLITRA